MVQGLDGVIAAQTVLSDVDGQAGRLVIRGRDVASLAAGFRFEEAVALLWEGFFDLPDLAGLTTRLGQARQAAFADLAALDPVLLRLEPIEAVRALAARAPAG